MNPQIERDLRKLITRDLQKMLESPGNHSPEAIKVAEDELIKRKAPLKAETGPAPYNEAKAPALPFFTPLVQGIARIYTDFFRPNLAFFLFAAAVPVLVQMLIEKLVVSEWDGDFSVTRPLYFALSHGSIAYRVAVSFHLTWLVLISVFWFSRKTQGRIRLKEFFLAVLGRIGGHFLLTFIALLAVMFSTYYLYDEIFIDGKPYPILSENTAGPHFLPSLLSGELSDNTTAMLSFLIVNLHVIVMYLIPLMAVQSVVRDKMISFPRSFGKVAVAVLVLHLLTQGMIFMLNVEVTPLILPLRDNDFPFEGPSNLYLPLCIGLQVLVHAVVMPLQLGLVSMQLLTTPEPAPAADEKEEVFGD